VGVFDSEPKTTSSCDGCDGVVAVERPTLHIASAVGVFDSEPNHHEHLAAPAGEKAFAAVISNARWWRQPRYHRSAGLRLNPFANFAGSLRGSQKFVGSLRGLHKGCAAGTVAGIEQAIDLHNAQLENTVPYGSPVTPTTVPASPQ